MATILLVNGPNLNLLGQREPEIYGSHTLANVEALFTESAQEVNHQTKCFQSNHEGALIDFLHKEGPQADFLIINPGALTHTSIALRDALLGLSLPFIEVHISNTYQRESFRHHSFLSDIALGSINGLGILGYQLALEAAIEYCEAQFVLGESE
jgi:3-dehydroquinate dehydratase-2